MFSFLFFSRQVGSSFTLWADVSEKDCFVEGVINQVFVFRTSEAKKKKHLAKEKNHSSRCCRCSGAHARGASHRPSSPPPLVAPRPAGWSVAAASAVAPPSSRRRCRTETTPGTGATRDALIVAAPARAA
jgi:hypothetical protein